MADQKRAEMLRLRDRLLFEAAAKLVRRHSFYRTFTGPIRSLNTKTDSKALEALCDLVIFQFVEAMERSLTGEERKQYHERLGPRGGYSIEDVIDCLIEIQDARTEADFQKVERHLGPAEYKRYMDTRQAELRRYEREAEADEGD